MACRMLKPIAIVVADDDEDDRLLINDAFQECEIGNPLCFVNDGQELMEYLRRSGPYEKLKSEPYPGLILLDLSRSLSWTCLTALEEIRNDAKLRNIPIVVLTTDRSNDAVAHLHGLGANSFITKPNTFEKLCDAVRALSHYWTDIVTIPPNCRESGLHGR